LITPELVKIVLKQSVILTWNSVHNITRSGFTETHSTGKQLLDSVAAFVAVS